MDLLYIKAIILGIVQGVTEFLPISSTGHLIIVEKLINVASSDTFIQMFDVVVQLGSIFAVVVYFWHQLLPKAMFTDVTVRKTTLDIWFKTLAGVIPAVIIGALLNDWMEEHLFNPAVVAGALIVGGILLFFFDRERGGAKMATIAELTYPKAIAIGFIQCLAMIPGTSRSASTIIGGLSLRASRTMAAEYSFFLAIPTMFGASAYKIMKHGLKLSQTEWIAVLIGSAVSFFVAWGVIAFFMSYIRKYNFRLFAWYRIALGVVVLAYFYIIK